MLFNSYEFILIFLPITWIIYFSLGKRFAPKVATVWLVLASLFFYGYWDVRYVPLLVVSICFNFILGRVIETRQNKKISLTLAVVCNLSLLGYYKYTGFFLSVANDALGGNIWTIPHIVLPLGISFFTFTQTAYLIDAYRGETKGYGFIDYVLFVTIFPHLIAGPIINHRDTLPQFSNKGLMVVDYKNLAIGLTLFGMGLFKKVIIADTLATFANPIFDSTVELTLLESWIGALGYSLQLYFDFSAYSEMAMGLGLLFNIKLPQNFNSPYQARNMIDFWRRWHMTLGAWVKDYLYIPMGGNRVGFHRKLINSFVAMTLVGLWHGAGWTFIFWGMLHGVYLMVNNIWRQLGCSMHRVFSQPLTLLAVVVAWVLFRADTINQALNVLLGMCGVNGLVLPSGGAVEREFGWLVSYGILFKEYPVNLFSSIKWIMGMLLLSVILPNPVIIAERFEEKRGRGWFCVAMILLFVCALCSISSVEKSEFLYFQF